MVRRGRFARTVQLPDQIAFSDWRRHRASKARSHMPPRTSAPPSARWSQLDVFEPLGPAAAAPVAASRPP